MNELNKKDLDSTLTDEPVHESQEVLVYRHYTRLGREIRDLTLERDNIKDTELIPDMEAGVMFAEGDGYLRFEFSESVKFDYKAARANGDISDEVWKKYTTVDITRKVMNRTLKDDAAAQAEYQLTQKIAELVKEHRKK